MSYRILPVVLALAMAGCSTLGDAFDSLNPFSSSAPKMAPLKAIAATAEVRSSWSANVGKAGEYTLSPAVVGNVVYVAAQDGTVAKLEEGRNVWQIKTAMQLSGGVGADGKMVVVGTRSGDVLAFSAVDGRTLWQAKVSSEVLAAPAVGEEGVAVRSGDNRIALLNLADGTRKWVYQRSTPALSIRSTAAPVFADRYLFAGFPGGKLVALALTNGAPIWEGTVAQPKGATEVDRAADVVAAPAVDGRQICAVAFQGRVACFDMGQGGSMVWSRDLSSASGLTLDGRYLFVTDDKGAVHALDRLTGSSLWKQAALFNRKVSAPAVKRGLVAVADGEGVVHFLSREDGSFVARKTTDGTPVRAAVQSIGAGFLVQTAGGSISKFEVQ
ncbi:outer membrane protein assembly factor BamB [Dechloromonas sp. ZY10]|uniref:outer membrane protein assembly factor BamB n=1 Tax=Dechloromonas aquae TaxID=2664436 RepID=UPI0035295FC5